VVSPFVTHRLVQPWHRCYCEACWAEVKPCTILVDQQIGRQAVVQHNQVRPQQEHDVTREYPVGACNNSSSSRTRFRSGTPFAKQESQAVQARSHVHQLWDFATCSTAGVAGRQVGWGPRGAAVLHLLGSRRMRCWQAMACTRHVCSGAGSHICMLCMLLQQPQVCVLVVCWGKVLQAQCQWCYCCLMCRSQLRRGSSTALVCWGM
jgi:hypothetical protein